MACVYLQNFILDKESGNTDIPLFRDIELNFSTATQKRAAKVKQRHIHKRLQKLNKYISSINIIYKANICCTCMNENVSTYQCTINS